MELISIIILVALVFLSTNIDNLMCLVGFFLDRTIETSHIFLGWFLGSFLIIFISFLLAFFGDKLISQQFIGVFGIIPILIGLKKIRDLKNLRAQNSSNDNSEKQNQKSQIFSGTLITLVNGGDNLSAYTPIILLQYQNNKIGITLFSFLMMTIIFSLFGYFFVRKNKYLPKSFIYAQVFLPFLLIFLGSSLMIKSFFV